MKKNIIFFFLLLFSFSLNAEEVAKGIIIHGGKKTVVTVDDKIDGKVKSSNVFDFEIKNGILLTKQLVLLAITNTALEGADAQRYDYRVFVDDIVEKISSGVIITRSDGERFFLRITS